MALALALICLGGSFAFADDEGGNRSMRGGRLPWQIRLPWTIGQQFLAAKRLTPQTSVEYGRTKPYQPTQLPRAAEASLIAGIQRS